MDYWELLETVKKHPDYFWTKEQQKKNSQHRYTIWLANRNKKTQEEKKSLNNKPSKAR